MPNEKKNKNIVQDIVSNKRSIRDIDIPVRKTRSTSDVITPKENNSSKSKIKINIKETTKEEDKYVEKEEIKIPKYNFEYEDTPKKSNKFFYISIFVFIIALAFGISSLFKSAVIKVSPNIKTVSFSENFIAKKTEDSSLSFQTVTLNKSIEKTVPATDEEQVSTKSSGTIIVYNNYSSQSQKLITNTRFQTSDGLIFRITSPVVVPGVKTISGKAVPGSIEAQVVADNTGDKYNIGLKDFTIPGFKGDPRYNKIYARSKTEMTGGFEGKQKIVSKEVILNTEKEMNDSLKSYLVNEISSQIPDNFILYENSLSYDFSPIVQVQSSSTNSVILSKKGVATAVIFDKGSLSRVIISKVMPEISNDLVKIDNLNNFDFEYPKDQKIDPTTTSSISFSLSGEAKFEWIFDQNKLKNDILGISKDKAMSVISSYKSINEAWIELSPFWNRTIPKDPLKVKIINTAEKI